MGSKYGGYMGEALWVDLGDGSARPFDISDRDRELFIGNKGLAAKILWDNLEPGIDPLSERNLLVVTTAPLTGSGAPSSSRFNISTKSPMTAGITSSNSGGNFGIYLKRAGFDALILAGKADKPVYLEINAGTSTIHDAKDLWGLDTEETQEVLTKKHCKCSMIVIGPAGENLVRYASIHSGERCNGRGGVGAVMGSKMLKAVVAIGNLKPPIPNPEEFKKVNKAWIHLLQAHPVTGGTLPQYGTAGLLAKANALSILPTHNFREGHFEFADEINGEALAQKYTKRNDGCMTCSVRCGRVVEMHGKEIKGPEFETLGMFGPSYGNKDLWKICEWNYLIDKLGMDTISAGSTIAFATELTEAGLLKSDLKWGKLEGMEKLLEQIAHREGLGDDLAEGTMRLAEKYGGSEYAIHSKGLELAAYEPRRSVGHGLGYATANRGGCHLNAGYLVYFENLGPVNIDPLSTMGKAGLTIFQQTVLEAISTVGSCVFTSYAIIPGAASKIKPYGNLARVLDITLRGTGDLMSGLFKLPAKAVPIHLPMIPHSKVVATLTGMKMGAGEFLAAGNRSFNMERMFNIREGLWENTLPDRLTKTLQDPNNPKTKVPLDVLLPRYYRGRGWDERGVPKPATLHALGMDFAVAEALKAKQSASEAKKTFTETRLAYEKKQSSAIKKRKTQNKALIA